MLLRFSSEPFLGGIWCISPCVESVLPSALHAHAVDGNIPVDSLHYKLD